MPAGQWPAHHRRGGGWKAGPAPLGGVEPGLTARDFPAWLLLHEPGLARQLSVDLPRGNSPPRSAIAASTGGYMRIGTPAGRGDGSAQKPAAEPSCVVRGVERSVVVK